MFGSILDAHMVNSSNAFIFFKGLIEKFIFKNLIMADKKVQSQKRPQNAVVSTATPEAREETSNVAYNEASIRNNLTVLEYSRTLQAAAR